MLVGGCLLTQSLDHYSGGQSADSAIDGQGILGDGSTIGEASDGEGPTPGPFCSSFSPKPTVCTDFDTAGFDAMWDEIESAGIATSLGVDTTRFVSSPNGFRASTPSNQTPDKYVYSFLRHVDTSTTVTKSVDMTIDWYFDGTSFAGANSNAITQISIPKEHQYDLEFRVDASGALVVSEFANNQGESFPTSVTLIPKTWYRLRMTYDHVAHALTAYVNGAKKIDALLLKKAPPTGAGYEWRVGSATKAPTEAFTCVVDNLAIDIK